MNGTNGFVTTTLEHDIYTRGPRPCIHCGVDTDDPESKECMVCFQRITGECYFCGISLDEHFECPDNCAGLIANGEY